ncbi:WD40 repeat-containing protein SMU1-like protein [Absidia repens]|uniref:WD40 repeat-containing protein SMU1 n=1 Tax=Absidia repens TaxID=90262 RepID=A0A1X2IQV5_9FUNG|nr:WD40 repeat-containing protein SMU1-like protein [Absidia repens]
MSIEIESEDIIRLLLQFFDEQNLNQSLHALEAETSIKLNTVANKEEFLQDIIQGKWDTVLQQVVTLNIRPKALVDLYEQVVLELTELRELGAARSLLRQSQPMYLLKQQHPERYLHLEHVLSRSIFDARDAYRANTTKEKRRQAIAKGLSNEISVAAPARLMTLLDQSAQWQEQQGLCNKDTFDVFGGGSGNGGVNKTETVETDQGDHAELFPGRRYKTIKFPGKTTYAECMSFSPDGQYFATGSVDGFIELWHPQNGKLRKDLKYQAEGNLMAMDESVISLAFSGAAAAAEDSGGGGASSSSNGGILISGSTDGKIAVWNIQSGFCKRRISPAHSQGVTSIQLNNKTTHILSGSYDQLIKIHEIKSGKLVKEFKGHTSFINSVAYMNCDMNIISSSSDGTIKIWDSESTECLSTITPSSMTLPVQLALPLPVTSTFDGFVVCNKSKRLSIYSKNGDLVKTIPAENDKDANHNIDSDFISAAVSSRGKLVYAITETGNVYGFNIETGHIVQSVKVSDTEIISMASHPIASIIAVNDAVGHVYLFKP